MSESHDPNMGQWALGAFTTLLGLCFAWLWSRVEGIENRLGTRIAENAAAHANTTTAGDRELWAALATERQRAEDFRTKIIEQVGALPNKADLAAMEERISRRIESHPWAGQQHRTNQ